MYERFSKNSILPFLPIIDRYLGTNYTLQISLVLFNGPLI